MHSMRKKITALAFACLAGVSSVGGCDDDITGRRTANADANSWRELKDRRLQAHGESIGNLAFSSDGLRLVSGSYDTTIRVLGMPQDFLQRIDGHEGPVMFVAFAPNAERVFSSAQDGTARLWRVSDGAQLKKLDIGGVVAVSPDGKILAVGESSEDERPSGEIRLIRLADGKLLHTLKSHKRRVMSLAYSQHGSLLASGGVDGEVRLWSVADGALIHRMKQEGRVGRVVFSPDGKLLASAGMESGTVRIWQVAEARMLLDRTLIGDTILDVSFSHDGSLLAVSSFTDEVPSTTLRLLRVADGKTVQNLVDDVLEATRVAFHPNQNLLAAGMQDGTIRFYSQEKRLAP